MIRRAVAVASDIVFWPAVVVCVAYLAERIAHVADGFVPRWLSIVAAFAVVVSAVASEIVDALNRTPEPVNRWESI